MCSLPEFIKKVISRYWRIVFLFGYKKIHVESIATKSIKISKGNIGCFALSSNPIKFIQFNSKTYVFRECFRHEAFEPFLTKRISEFYQLAIQGAAVVNFSLPFPFRV